LTRAAAVFVLGFLAAAPSALATEPRPAAAGSDDVAAPDPRSVVGPPRGQALSGAALEARTEEVAGVLRCPVCQGLSVADSPVALAQHMKGQVKELLAQGYDEDQILRYFETSYGEFVRLEPPLRGVNWLVWLAPVVGLIGGGFVVAWALRAPRRVAPAEAPAPGAAEVPGPGTLPEDGRLAAYVLKVREIAYGWPGGVPPEKAS
jgi:cytochrome c-type biogenesis protein CcmH